MGDRGRFIGCIVAGFFLASGGWAQGRNARPVIEHDPVKVAVRGQPLTVLARVTDDSGEVKSVALYYSVSRDAAPFCVPMKGSGPNTYYGTIPPEHFEEADTLFYYVEATDAMDASQETPWYSVAIRSAAGDSSSAPVGAQAPSREDEGTVRWGTVGLIAGGAAAVVGGAFFLSGGGRGDGDSSSGIQPGDYDGTVTECFTPAGGSTDCSSHALTIQIKDDGSVWSSSMRHGYVLHAVLRGNRFTFRVPLDDPTNGVGQVVYGGTVANDTIVGTISGEAATPMGSGQYSGAFTATRRP